MQFNKTELKRLKMTRELMELRLAQLKTKEDCVSIAEKQHILKVLPAIVLALAIGN